MPPSCCLVSPAVCPIASRRPLIDIVLPSRPLVAPPSRPLVVQACCHIAFPRPLVAPAGCCIASRCAALLLSCRLAVPPLVVSSRQLVVASSSLVVLSLHRPLVLSSCWLVVVLPLLAPPYGCRITSHCHLIAPPYRFIFALSHCLSPSSRCATLSSSHRTSLLSHRLSSSSSCTPRRPLVLSSCRLVVVLSLDAPPSRRLVVLLCRLLLSRHASWLLHQHLSSSSRCTTTSVKHHKYYSILPAGALCELPRLLGGGLGSQPSYGILYIVGLKSLIFLGLGMTDRKWLTNNRNRESSTSM